MDARSRDTLALITHRIPVEMHHHHAVQMVLSLDIPYPAVLDGHCEDSVHGFLIDSNVPHACQASESTVLVVSVDADTVRGRSLKQRLNGKRYLLIDDLLEESALTAFRADYRKFQSGARPGFDPLALVSALAGTPESLPEPDPRILATMAFVTRHLSHPLRLADIAAAVALSEGRLRHLFVRDVGISLSTFILWSRMKAALHAIVIQGRSLAEAARHAGFADQAHFSRMFRRMFGISPSLLLKYARFLEVFAVSNDYAE